MRVHYVIMPPFNIWAIAGICRFRRILITGFTMKGIIKNIFGQKSEASRVITVSTVQPEISFVPRDCYFEIGVVQAHVADLDGLLKDYAPLIFSEISATFGARRIELQQVIDPRDDLWSSKGREHQGYRSLVRSMPYVDHSIDFRIGLFRVLAKDHASTVIKLLSGLSATFLPQHKILSQLAITLNDGVDELVHDATSFIAGRSVEFRQNEPLAPGTYVVTSDPELGKEPLWFENGTLLEGEQLSFAVPVRRADFIAYTVEIKDSREDYMFTEEVAVAYESALEAIRRVNVDSLNQAFEKLRSTVMTSPAFTLKDAKRIVVALNNDIAYRWDLVKKQEPQYTLEAKTDGGKEAKTDGGNAPPLAATVTEAEVADSLAWSAK